MKLENLGYGDVEKIVVMREILREIISQKRGGAESYNPMAEFLDEQLIDIANLLNEEEFIQKLSRRFQVPQSDEYSSDQGLFDDAIEDLQKLFSFAVAPEDNIED